MSGRFHISFVGHACLKISVGNLRILTDPWIDGPAYTRQWYQYPSLDRSVPLDDVQYIHYSHGHEDHLHQPSFHLLPKTATVLLTRQWFAGNVEWLQSEGFRTVREITSGKWTRLTGPTGRDTLECVNLVNRSDSLSIMTTEKEVLVNVNDALHCYDADCIDYYCGRIQKLLHGRSIDYLFCGFGGASYFPNCLRHAAKDDRHVAMARERHLAQGFARVVRNLKPQMAFAFAANLVLLDPVNHWINEIKFLNDPVALTEDAIPAMRGRVFKLLPGDVITAAGLERRSSDCAAATHVAEYQRLYADEIAKKKNRPLLSEDAADEVLRKLSSHFIERLQRIGSNRVSFDWAVCLRDCPAAILRVTQQNGVFHSERLSSERLPEVRDMVVSANSEVLLAGLESTWGGDS
ncbi:MAG TPA: MBL fold metallo-hydrolase, partial [Candidatus Angelobacter sp.]|nr:MBL fold metallo-hydrolase [Candidatus Angelobacter sp.]